MAIKNIDLNDIDLSLIKWHNPQEVADLLVQAKLEQITSNRRVSGLAGATPVEQNSIGDISGYLEHFS
jgi:hypothetical protein